jgi:hypothetical protein
LKFSGRMPKGIGAIQPDASRIQIAHHVKETDHDRRPENQQ